MAATLALAACSAPAVTLPDDPPGLTRVDRYPFGDMVHGRDVRAWTAAFDRLEPRYGKLRLGSRVLSASISTAALRTEIATRLEPQGWRPAPELAAWPRIDGSYAFGWSKDGKVYAIVGLDHRPGETASPANVVTNIGDPGEPL